MSDKPAYYFSSPEFQELVARYSVELVTRLEEWLAEILQIGGESDEQLSALSHWTATIIMLGARRLELRAEIFTGVASTDEQYLALLKEFVNDAAKRAIGAGPEMQVH